MNPFALLAVALLVYPFPLCAATTVHNVADYLPASYVRDGSVAYHAEIQQAIDAAAKDGGTLVFPAMTYAASEEGWQLRPNMTLRMRGAVFQLPETADKDGAVFIGSGVSDLTIVGGEILGCNDVWKDGVNVRGMLITGRSKRIRIDGMQFRDLSSNGIGIFGEPEQYVRDVWVRDVIVENCCKRYPDYLSNEKSEPNSVREDQGDVALYYVEDFLVDGCRFEQSRSDGTHFYRCRIGQITGNRIYRAKMGGYFLETCERVVGSGNVIVENGSRGATIERGSKNCVFTGNIVSDSGREGLWAPNCVGLVVTGNIFKHNGRKSNGTEPHYIWNANITINSARHDPTDSPIQDYLVSDNLIYTTGDQIAAIRVVAADNTRRVVIQDNLLLDENHEIVVEGPQRSEVVVSSNHGEADRHEVHNSAVPK